jgi:DNA-binding transcriptional regulator YdaS (Cro superfamily)
MNFDQWLDKEEGRASRVATHFGVSRSAVSQWRKNGVPTSNMKGVRDLSGGEVSLEEMLPEPARPSKQPAVGA